MLLSSLVDIPAADLAGALTAGDEGSRRCLRDWLARVPDPRSPLGRWHSLEYVLALAVCAFTAAGHDSPTAVAEWAVGCCAADPGRPGRAARPVDPADPPAEYPHLLAGLHAH